MTAVLITRKKIKQSWLRKGIPFFFLFLLVKYFRVKERVSERDKSGKMEFSAILIVFIHLLSLTFGKRVCAPGKFNSDVTEMYFAGNVQEGPEQAIFSFRGKLAYDYMEKRWAFDRFDFRNASNNLRIVVDHGKDRMFVKTEAYCVVSPVGDVKMYPACIPGTNKFFFFYSYKNFIINLLTEN